ncbi:ankyrin repeat domain-containing protein [Flavobacterium alvei]|uniref:Ankyrin repeat domain-containing protein n=1 Tax=Flavobacterium alvei TaxID=2080416 RepID=A0A2S5A0U6_9FLAO|nr:ankyrin repeat domain-containing protein [Flavobacterium alvei]POY35897.1 ankyrin repeat domain-containing protein [Flavobacterium alvei]
MKKSIVYLGLALVAFTNVSMASGFNPEKGNETTITVYEGVSPFNNAIVRGDVEAVKKFIAYGSDVNEKSNGMSPLMLAARYNKVEILKILISNGADVKAKDERGFTALKHAELSNAKEAIQILKQAQ